MSRFGEVKKCRFDNCGCTAIVCYSNQRCGSRDENGNPLYSAPVQPDEPTQTFGCSVCTVTNCRACPDGTMPCQVESHLASQLGLTDAEICQMLCPKTEHCVDVANCDTFIRVKARLAKMQPQEKLELTKLTNQVPSWVKTQPDREQVREKILDWLKQNFPSYFDPNASSVQRQKELGLADSMLKELDTGGFLTL